MARIDKRQIRSIDAADITGLGNFSGSFSGSYIGDVYRANI